MGYKDLIKTTLVEAIKKNSKDDLLLNFILDSRREFVEFRLNQEKQIEKAFKYMEQNLLKFLKTLSEDLTSNEVIKLFKFVDNITVDLRFDLDRIINENIKKVVELGGNTYKDMFAILLKQANITKVTNKMFDIAIDKNNKKIIAVITNQKWSKKGTARKLSGRIWKSSLYARKGIKDVIKKGLDNELSTQQLAKNIQKYMVPSARKKILKKELNLGRTTPSNPHYFAMRVARSEIQASYQNSMYENGEIMPNYTGIIWLLSNRHPDYSYYEICEQLADTTKYGEKGFFPKGKEPRLSHPQCLCSQVMQFGDLNKFIDRLKKWDKDPKSDKKLENWYKKYMK